MHGDYDVFLKSMSGFLGGYYLFLAVVNAVAAFYLWETGKARTLFRIGRFPVTTALAWLAVAGVFTIIAPIALGGGAGLLRLPLAVEEAVNRFMDPTVYTLGSLVILGVLFVLRRFFVQPWVAWSLLNLSLLLMGLSMTNPSFAAIVTKPDNVPIVGMVFLLGFFTWLGAYRAVQNDDRARRNEPPLESLENEKVLVWPDLVYTELICMVALTALMIVWAVALQAPLEEPASSVKTPNPSKAPWYFLGLQEMLVYYDPWMAGVVLPSLVVFGLMAIPYLDFNKQGSGYYTIDQRKFAYITFQFGFLVLWVTLIVMGTFLRGPNWNFFGPYEVWDAHKVEALSNVDLSEYFWISALEMGRPQAPEGAGEATKVGYILLREGPGILLVLFYFIAVPPMLAVTVMRKFFLRMGFIRFMVLANLLLFMALLPIKMLFRWTLNLKYFVAIPEYFLNF
ncbi:MAG: hypothetical protein KY475_04420 [Planctomycetes bacterium]|nr:hypothetical protein [Planctomycetota bacterium]